VNAIDPAVITENSTGRQYLSYGSFWGESGSSARPETGLVDRARRIRLPIASRPRSVDGAIEGSYIIHNPATGFYYLFVSYGSLFADYNVRVARSRSITGPYLDRNGIAMTDTSAAPESVGFKLLGGYRFGESQGWIAPGHNSVLRRGDEWFVVHHMRPENDTSWAYLCVRKMCGLTTAGPSQVPCRTRERLNVPSARTKSPVRMICVAFGNGTPAGNVENSRL
jgi:arabinan endo-1,5-alpha-L-arabinosidase